ncbi:Protein-L-isoaspartate(D-aspartate) O-methyltransferase [Trichormus variabilis ATCC 29413]|uniref:Protein-L-isoaspartate(D-aspartate) O-methyltransferase n=2 Tax=Anabaena variabilis TaxID=264691 RepID=Q3M8Y5_TRIV2|nr:MULTISPECIES: methyltransferase domain-containing protein [Nostocaceae]ABA22551.1 Protein-L-isoaspartate(D-aspartate) O-methyltransferase [Trichormus variabilis ATCC 29413]MBC1212978.1 class I SAM-dependent methyltransferase [Trichormus variabilis ARAD]MBC1254626.1 class I SAM-dependent methyltransferase [Trichormus variabilis V5]MBC1265925.1 class I SAM-dependent methyltransferase [Trichormus variabilis FSR]MBC1300964.1 class I SAM-dependent methyltransferase [Trichormus variabilis N2B]
MDNREYEQKYKIDVINFFDSRTSYDNDYTIRRALPLLELIPLKTGQKVLDLATGTGIIAIAAAEIVGSTGKVIGVDFSSGMLAQAEQKIKTLGWQNIELIKADAEYINFEDESFDVILCSTAIVYFQDIPAALGKWYRFLKKGGIVGFSCCSQESCEAPTLIKACAENDILLVNINEPTGTIEKCHHLMQAASFENIEVKTQQLGFYRSLEQAKRWNGGWFHPRENPLLNLSSAQMEKLQAEYCREIEAKATEQGVWYENLTFFVSGQKI